MSTFQDSGMQYEIAGIPMDTLGFQTTSETFQMKCYVKFYQNCQGSELKVPYKSVFIKQTWKSKSINSGIFDKP